MNTMNTQKMPVYQEFNIEGVSHISPQDALSALQHGTAIIIDVREKPECDTESIPLNGLYYYPMSDILNQLQSIPDDKPIIVLCNAGVRSTRVTDFMTRNGFANTINLDGGIIAWKALGLPFNSDNSSECAYGFSCSG